MNDSSLNSGKNLHSTVKDHKEYMIIRIQSLFASQIHLLDVAICQLKNIHQAYKYKFGPYHSTSVHFSSSSSQFPLHITSLTTGSLYSACHKTDS